MAHTGAAPPEQTPTSPFSANVHLMVLALVLHRLQELLYLSHALRLQVPSHSQQLCRLERVPDQPIHFRQLEHHVRFARGRVTEVFEIGNRFLPPQQKQRKRCISRSIDSNESHDKKAPGIAS
jgi:hypothetical protein